MEKKICKFFKENGYHVIAPEQCTLSEQIHYIKNCNKIAVISGTLPHNILFAHSEVCISVINRSGGVNFYQPLINQVRNATITYIDAHLSIFPVFARGPYLLQINENIKNYAKDYQMNIRNCEDNIISIHIKLAWYFFSYLDHVKDEDIQKWCLNEKSGIYVMNMSGFYRNRFRVYDSKKCIMLRKIFNILVRVFE